MPDRRAGRANALSGRDAVRLAGAGVALIAVCYGLARFAYGLYVPVFRAEFSLDAGAAGAIASGSYVAYCAAIIASTLLTARLGARAVAIGAGVVATVGVVIVAAAPTPAILAVGVLVAGSSTGVASPPLADAVARGVSEARRARVQAVVNAGTGVGVAVAGPIALVTPDHWRAAWVGFAVLCAIATAAVAFAVPPGGRGGRSVALLPRPLLPTGARRLVWASVTAGVSSAAVWTFGRDVLGSTGGLGDGAASAAWIVLGAVGVVGAAAGDLIRRVGLATSWTSCMLAMGGATVLLAARPGDLPAALIASAVFGVAYIALTGLLLVWGTTVYPRQPAAGVGVAFLVLALGQAAGALLVGTVSTGATPSVAFAAAGAVAAAGAALRPRHR